MSRITTHILDLSSGQPARAVDVTLELLAKKRRWILVGKGKTDADGRLKTLLPEGSRLKTGTYRLNFAIAAYFRAQKRDCFFPVASVVFNVRNATQHYHLPLLVSPYGYSTYRGS